MMVKGKRRFILVAGRAQFQGAMGKAVVVVWGSYVWMFCCYSDLRVGGIHFLACLGSALTLHGRERVLSTRCDVVHFSCSMHSEKT